MEIVMGWQPGKDGGAGASPDRDPGASGAPPARDPRLDLFAGDGTHGAPSPSGRLALLADELSGPKRRCPGATDNELTGLLRVWAAIESWAAGAKLGVIAELIRRDDVSRESDWHGDLPDEWSASLRHELAAALACSAQSAETTAWLAWEQQARLRGVGTLLADGTLTYAKARAVIETFRYLADADAARAEALIVDQLAGKTYTQVLRLAEQAALTVDPELARRRREQAQQKDARVTFLREQAGTAALSGRDLPPDEALAAMSNVNARAEEYRESGAFGDTRMDVLRAYAYLDLLNGETAGTRIASAEPQDEAAEAAEALAWAEARAAARTASEARAAHSGDQDDREDDTRERGHGGHSGRSEDEDEVRDLGRHGHDGDDDEPDDSAGPGDNAGPDDGGGPGPGGPARPGAPSAGTALQLRPPDLIVPLVTLLGLAERPGEIQGFGLLDPALARDLADAAAASPRSEVCVTVTSPEGYAIGHGCARPDRVPKGTKGPGSSLAGLPARLNLTIPATALAGLSGFTDLSCLTGQSRHAGPWAFTPRGSPVPTGGTGPPDGFGTWTLTLPGGRRFSVRLDPVPTVECDHRYETHGYQPSDKLRHLVQVRDGACTFPPCSRHARESDFEHATPYHKGGRTCACNAGARSRACHRVKQSKGWNVTQPKPGWHQWETPAGRIYIQGPWRYPA
jgi:hypothetical protein